MRYWIAAPITLDANQYSGSPLGILSVKKANINGIIHCMMRWVDCWLASAVGMALIFWSTHMEMPTRTGSIGDGLGLARSSHRNWLLRGINWSMFTKGSQEYRCEDRPASFSGVAGNAWIMDRYSPIQIGN